MADCTLFNFIVWGLIGAVLCCFGCLGNALSLVAFQKDRRSSATTLLQCLAASDFMLLLNVFITDALPYICDYTKTCHNVWIIWPYIRYIWILTPLSHMWSIWFVVLIALNRFWAVCLPHTIHHTWSLQRTVIYVCGVLFVVLSFNIPRFFEYAIVETTREVNVTTYNDTANVTITTVANETSLSEVTTEFGSAHSYRVVYKVMLVNIILVMVPIVLLICLTAKILYSLHSKRGTMASKNKGASKSSQEITFVLVLVVVVSIVCQTPLCVFHFVRYSARYTCGDFVFYLDNISKLLVNINSSINFVIYCLFSPKFRLLLLMVVTCQGPNQIGPWFSSSCRRESWKEGNTFIGSFKESFRRAKNHGRTNKAIAQLKIVNSTRSLNGMPASSPKLDVKSLRSVHSTSSLGKHRQDSDDKPTLNRTSSDETPKLNNENNEQKDSSKMFHISGGHRGSVANGDCILSDIDVQDVESDALNEEKRIKNSEKAVNTSAC